MNDSPSNSFASFLESSYSNQRYREFAIQHVLSLTKVGTYNLIQQFNQNNSNNTVAPANRISLTTQQVTRYFNSLTSYQDNQSNLSPNVSVGIRTEQGEYRISTSRANLAKTLMINPDAVPPQHRFLFQIVLILLFCVFLLLFSWL